MRGGGSGWEFERRVGGCGFSLFILRGKACTLNIGFRKICLYWYFGDDREVFVVFVKIMTST